MKRGTMLHTERYAFVGATWDNLWLMARQIDHVQRQILQLSQANSDSWLH